MSFNQKIIYTSFIILTLIFGSGVLYYKKTHSRRWLPPPPKPELTITIIPGWNLRQVEDYLIGKGLAQKSFLEKIMVPPAVNLSLTRSLPTSTLTDPFNPPLKILQDKPWSVSYEGYLAPDTYRVFADASVKDIFLKLIKERDSQFTEQMYADIANFWNHVYNQNNHSPLTVHQALTMASIIEKEVKYDTDRAMVADILWRRLDKRWALQVDSSVHYAVDRTGDVFTTDKERNIDSPWNTYKYPGLPPGPIANPGLESIKAAIYPEKNSYWYFLSDKDGHMHYAKTLDEHNLNKAKYLR